MDDGQWRLTCGSAAYTFGGPTDALILEGPPDLGDPELTVDDARNPRADGMRFGLDYRGGATHTFELAAVTDGASGYDGGTYGDGPYGADNPRVVLDLVAEARAAWRGDSLRSVPGAVGELTAYLGGVERTAFGRPRRFAVSLEDAHQGVALVTCDFAAVDDLWYGPQQSLTIGIVPPPGAGLLAPLASPLSTAMTGTSRPGVFTVNGDAATWPVLTATAVGAPLVSPTLSVGEWSISLATTIAAGHAVTIDTRPWVRTVLLDGTASLAGAVTRASRRLTKASLTPGSHELTLRGTDTSGTATLSVAWRDAYTTP